MPPHTPNDPFALALAALAATLTDERRAERFLALTGIGTGELRLRAAEPALLSALIAFLAAHEPDLLSVSEAIGVRADELVAAGRQIDAEGKA
ncbi:MAG: DUF3572 family protein [Sphingomicrobium sp.]